MSSRHDFKRSDYVDSDDLVGYEVVPLDHGAFMAVLTEDHILRFIALEGLSWDSDNNVQQYRSLFYGTGVLGLRECRHTWWGENDQGYLFYPDLKRITACLQYLTKYFDMD